MRSPSLTLLAVVACGGSDGESEGASSGLAVNADLDVVSLMATATGSAGFPGETEPPVDIHGAAAGREREVLERQGHMAPR